MILLTLPSRCLCNPSLLCDAWLAASLNLATEVRGVSQIEAFVCLSRLLYSCPLVALHYLHIRFSSLRRLLPILKPDYRQDGLSYPVRSSPGLGLDPVVQYGYRERSIPSTADPEPFRAQACSPSPSPCSTGTSANSSTTHSATSNSKPLRGRIRLGRGYWYRIWNRIWNWDRRFRCHS